MNIRHSHWSKAFSTGISLLMLMLSVAVPLLERADLSHETVVESEHNPLRCPPAHDHTVCTQASANHTLPGSRQSVCFATSVFAEGPQPTLSVAATRILPEGHPSRAPPLA